MGTLQPFVEEVELKSKNFMIGANGISRLDQDFSPTETPLVHQKSEYNSFVRQKTKQLHSIHEKRP